MAIVFNYPTCAQKLAVIRSQHVLELANFIRAGRVCDLSLLDPRHLIFQAPVSTCCTDRRKNGFGPMFFFPVLAFREQANSNGNILVWNDLLIGTSDKLVNFSQ